LNDHPACAAENEILIQNREVRKTAAAILITAAVVAGAGRYRDAIAVFSEGLSHFPNSCRLLRCPAPSMLGYLAAAH
jgi:hypothetical protein